MILTYDISALIPYINWPYYYFAWQVKEPAEKERLRTEAEAFLRQQEGRYHAYAVFELFAANADGDDIAIGTKRIPLSVNSKDVRPISVWQISSVPFHQVSRIK